MSLRDIFRQRKTRLPSRPLVTDWSTSWSTRDWADLPTCYPAGKDADRR